MEKLKEGLFALLKEKGAELIGIADLRDVIESGYPTGVCVMLPIPKHIAEDLKTNPTKEYFDMYHSHNARLNEMAEAGAAFLREKGFSAAANTTKNIIPDENFRTALPHKTVAAKAGLGWIGKSCLLVTEEYGGAFRMTTLLTDAPLPAGTPITESRCGGCLKCVEVCPAQALTGKNWKAGMAREALVDVFACKKTIQEQMERVAGFRADTCGKCFAVCPYTQRYLEG